jgi:hypothetical protein
MEREQKRIPLQIAPGKTISLSPGEHSKLNKQHLAPKLNPVNHKAIDAFFLAGIKYCNWIARQRKLLPAN